MCDVANMYQFPTFLSALTAFSDLECLYLFRFQNIDVLRMVTAIAWPENRIRSKRNWYTVTSILASYILLQLLATPCR